MKNSPDHYLHFTRRERNGIVVLLSVSLLIVLVPHFYFLAKKTSLPVPVQYAHEVAMLKEMPADSGEYNFRKTGDGQTGQFYNKNSATFEKEDLTRKLYIFDPNTIGIPGWKSLGVKEKTATGIRHYIEKGGRFRRPEDIRKIWGLSGEMKKRLIPYINIVEKDIEENHTPIKLSSNERKP